MSALKIEPEGESTGPVCECCGNETKSFWGYITENEITEAAYFVQWTTDAPEHGVNFDFLVGTWGSDLIRDKKLLAWRYNPTHRDGGAFMAIDGGDRPAAKSELCSEVLSRAQIINEWMELSGAMIDAVWMDDPRIAEIRNLGPED